MDNFSVTTTLNDQDLTATRRAVLKRIGSRVNVWMKVAPFGVGAIMVAFVSTLDLPISIGSAFVGGAIVYAYVAATNRIRNRLVQNFYSDASGGLTEYEFSSTGIRVIRSGTQSLIEWSEFSHFEVSTRHLFVWFKYPSALVVPIRDWPVNLSLDDAATRMRYWMTNCCV